MEIKRMKRKFECTRENPLHSQLSNLDSSLIQEITIKGFLCDEDYELLTKMSGETGNLRILNLYEVCETDCQCENSYGKPEQRKIEVADNAFEDSIRLEKIILPAKLEAIGSPTFGGCTNLEGVDFPESLNSIGSEAFLDCPKLGEVYISKNLSLGEVYSHAFSASANSFVCDWDRWPVNKDGDPTYRGDGFGYFSYNGVLFFGFVWDECIELEKYPSMNDRSTYQIPYGTQIIKYGAFSNCKFLHKLIFPETCGVITEGSICGCPELETLVLRNQGLDGERVHHMDLYWGDVITNCPKLKDIYLYAENPENIAFGVFEKLDNMSEIVLHVPCFCAKKYRDYEEEYCSMYDYNDKKYVKVWRKFKSIEEFDPVDFLEDGI